NSDTNPTGKFKARLYGPGGSLTLRPDGIVDYPFDLIPGNGGKPDLRNHRVFDTWSMQEDTTGPQGPEYTYGRPRADTGGLQNGRVPGLGSYTPENGNLAQWNAGHFAKHPKDFIPESVPVRIRLKAVQIKIRIWDVK